MLAILGLPGGWEWIIVLVVALLIFGKRLPSVMRSLAQSIVGFKHELQKAKDDIDSEDAEEESAGAKKLPESGGTKKLPETAEEDDAEAEEQIG